jgi:hypothetical protein
MQTYIRSVSFKAISMPSMKGYSFSGEPAGFRGMSVSSRILSSMRRDTCFLVTSHFETKEKDEHGCSPYDVGKKREPGEAASIGAPWLTQYLWLQPSMGPYSAVLPCDFCCGTLST